MIDRESLIGFSSSNPKAAAKLVVFKFKVGEDSSGYDDAYLPFGPNWNATSIKKFLEKKRSIEIRNLKKKGEIKSESEYQPFFIFGTLEEVLDCKRDIGKISRKITWEIPK